MASLAGGDRCLWHSDRSEHRELRQATARAGGVAKYDGPTPCPPFALGLGPMALQTAAGCRELLGHVLAGLADGTVDARTAHAIAQVAGVQRAIVETSDLELRLGALEAGALPFRRAR